MHNSTNSAYCDFSGLGLGLLILKANFFFVGGGPIVKACFLLLIVKACFFGVVVLFSLEIGVTVIL